MTDQALVIEGLQVERGGRTVVRGASLRVPAGEIRALLGPNGAGKSSLVLALAGVLPLSGGTITLNGRELAGRRPEGVRAAGLATVPEGHRVLGDLTVADNLAVAAAVQARGRRDAALARVHELFPELESIAGRRARSLSGGQQQMLALGQALAGEPRFLVVDELSLGLAPVVVRRLVPALKAIAGQGVGVLLIEQFTHVALMVSHEVYALVGGHIRLHEPAGRLRDRPELLEAVYHLAESVTIEESEKGT
ncbi:ABC transporter ATP-binding protein [Nonomuraea sp. 3N208]|uniref:ABC transporter ATP-binding protein n=1 Tax=Nonomuraea sp. 3N208 TaxID=3457421 RepID=UPI003FD48297